MSTQDDKVYINNSWWRAKHYEYIQNDQIFLTEIAGTTRGDGTYLVETLVHHF